MLPVIRTPRLLLRPRGREDFEASLAMDLEPGTTRWIEGPWEARETHEAFIRARIDGPYPDGLGYWVIARKSRPQEFLGWVLLIPEDARGPDVEIGWRMTTQARGQGFAPEAAANLLSYGFETVGLGRVIAEIHRENTASRRVAEKIGMQVDRKVKLENPHSLLYSADLSCAGVPMHRHASTRSQGAQ
ncbi:MAG: GNAT family N-acetyltransferase [Pseudomonadota bacterium]